MREKITIAISFLLAATIGIASAETYVIHPDGSGDFPTIQAAINASGAGDIIELSDGTFVGAGNRDLDYCGKAITVRSQSGDPGTCTIDCQSNGHWGVAFQTGEGPSSVLEAVTITHARVGDWAPGGAVRCRASSPTIINCVFRNNDANSGGGLGCEDSSNPTIRDCVFLGNEAWMGGGWPWRIHHQRS